MVDMAKRGRPKGTGIPAGERRETVVIRLHPDMIQALANLVDENKSTRTAEVATAIREHLIKHGQWPLKDEKQ